ncbi:MAG: carbon storage regulator [Planctomycetes bacterium]|nr:carbon storage regulator [Planctomycetota bacterium]
MLVLSRKNRQSVVIDGRITIKVLQIKGNSIRLGIEAPREMSVRRGELEERPELEIRLAADDDGCVSYTCAAS